MKQIKWVVELDNKPQPYYLRESCSGTYDINNATIFDEMPCFYVGTAIRVEVETIVKRCSEE